jgi:hypothetical protein
MSTTQKAKITIEVGPGMPGEVGAFMQPDAFAAMLIACFRLITAERERVYAGADVRFSGYKGDFTAQTMHRDMQIARLSEMWTVGRIQWTADVTLKTADDADEYSK